MLETMQFCRVFRPAPERMAVAASDVCAPLGCCIRGGWRSHVRVWRALDVSLRQHNSVERFDTLSEVWEAQPAMAQKRFKARAAVIRKRIYVVGGFIDPTTCSVERFDRRMDHGATYDQMSLLDSRHRPEALRLWW